MVAERKTHGLCERNRKISVGERESGVEEQLKAEENEGLIINS